MPSMLPGCRHPLLQMQTMSTSLELKKRLHRWRQTGGCFILMPLLAAIEIIIEARQRRVRAIIDLGSHQHCLHPIIALSI